MLSNIRYLLPSSKRFKTGDTFPPAELTVKGGPSTLVGATCALSLRNVDETLIIGGLAGVVSGVAVEADGTYTCQLSRSWLAGELDVVGEYVVEFEVTLSDGSIFTIPADDGYTIQVREALEGQGSLQIKPFGTILQTGHGFTLDVPFAAKVDGSGLYAGALAATSFSNLATGFVVPVTVDYLRFYGSGQHIPITGYTAGDELFLSQSVSGEFSSTEPSNGFIQKLGVVDTRGILPNIGTGFLK